MSKPWENEPDEVRLTDDDTGYPVALKRHKGPMHWCGYIGVPSDHPWHGKNYNELVAAPAGVQEREMDVDEVGIINLFCGAHKADPAQNLYPIDILVRCHGGLTFAGEPYWEDDRATWWFGFDCAHAGDLCPGHMQYGLGDGDTYRDVAYVTAAAAKAARDLRAAA